MASMMASQTSSDIGSTEYIHELIQQVGQDALTLDDGENWLRLAMASTGSNNVLDDTQDAEGGIPYPSILSLKEVGSIDAPSSDCYICIDVDGPFVAVKDMRPLMTTDSYDDEEDNDDDGNFEICIQRRKFPCEEEERNDDIDKDADYHPPELLPRRQLRILCPFDRICTRRQIRDSQQSQKGLVLKYTRETALYVKRKILKDASSQQSTQESNLKRESTGHITERIESQVSNKLITQRSQHSMALECLDNDEDESDDDGIDDDPDRTQIIPMMPDIDRLSTQSPIKEDTGESDDETTLVGNESASGSMNQPTQPFSCEGTSKPLEPIMNEKGEPEISQQSHEDKIDSAFHETSTEQNLALSTQKDEDRVEMVMDVRERLKIKKSIEFEGTKLINAFESLVTDGVVAKQNAIIDFNKDDSETSKGSTAKANKYAGKVQSKPNDSAVSKCTGIKIAGLPDDERATNGIFLSTKSPEKANSTNNIGPCANVNDADSDATMLSEVKEPEISPMQAPCAVDDVQIPDVQLQCNVAVDEVHQSEVMEPPKDAKRQVGNSNERVADTTMKLKDLGEGCSTQEIAERKSFLSPAKLDRPQEWESIVSPAEDSWVTTCQDTQRDDSDLSDPEDTENTSLTRKRNLKTSRRAVRQEVLSMGVDGGMLAPKAKPLKSSREVTGKESSSIGTVSRSLPSKKTEGSVPPKGRSSSLSPSLIATGTLSVTMATKQETQRSKRDLTCSSQKRALTDIEPVAPASRSSRKRARQDEAGEPIRVLITGVDMIPRHKHMIAAIGGELIEKVEDAEKATHVIAGDDKNSLRRTPKVMIGVCRTSNIVHMDWLTASAKNRSALPCRKFLLLNDAKAETAYGFKMRETLSNGNRMRQEGKTLLNGMSVFICDGVAGNKAPPENELKLIINAAGGKWVTAPALAKVKAPQTIIITSNPAQKGQLSAKEVSKAIKKGTMCRTTNWLFDCIMKQELSLNI